MFLIMLFKFFHMRGSASVFLSFILIPYFFCLFFLSKMCVFLYLPSGCGRDVGVPVHEALHGWGDVPTPPGLLPASPQQLLRLLGPIPPPRRLGRPGPQSLLHLLRGFPPDELLHLPSSAQVSRVRTNVVVALLRSVFHRTGFWPKTSHHSAVIHFLISHVL